MDYTLSGIQTKITKPAEQQKGLMYEEWHYSSIKTSPQWTQMVELLEKDVETVTVIKLKYPGIS